MGARNLAERGITHDRLRFAQLYTFWLSLVQCAELPQVEKYDTS